MSSRRQVRRQRTELDWQSWLDDRKMRLVVSPLLSSLVGPLTAFLLRSSLEGKQDSPSLQDAITDCLADPVGCVINPIAENPTSPLLLAIIGAVTFGNITVDIVRNMIINPEYLGGGTAVSASKNPPIKKQKEEKEDQSPFFPFLPGGCSKCNTKIMRL